MSSTTVDRQAVAGQLVLHEGLRLSPYVDTEGFWTVLVGYNLSSRGWEPIERALGRTVSHVGATTEHPFGNPPFTVGDAARVLAADLDRLEKAMPVTIPFYPKLSEVRRRVFLDMAFNMGTKIQGFRQTLAAAEAQDWSRCAREMYNSKWSRQVGDGPGGRRDRCDRLVQMILTNNPPTDVPALPDGFVL